MFKLFLLSHGRMFKLWLQCLTTPGRGWIRLLLFVVWPLFVMLQLGHWLGFLLDELLFRGYRKVKVGRPLFVVGPPRSGTTHLHHVLSADAETTTFSFWECLFGLSVTSKKLIVLLVEIDQRICRPFGRLMEFCQRRWLSALDDVHPLRLDSPEEDFLAFIPLAQCFILIVIFPKAGWLWRTARLDAEMSTAERAQWAGWYQQCVQKHLYVFGTDKTFLSKNASFSGSVETLLQIFPDASLVVCSRDPLKTMPSQLSSLLPGLRAAGFRQLDADFKQRMMGLLKFYYLHLHDVAQRHPQQVVFLDNAALRNDLSNAVASAFAQLGRNVSPEFAASLRQADQQSRNSSSAHRYTLEDFDLDEQQIRQYFAEVYTRFRFGEVGPVLR